MENGHIVSILKIIVGWKGTNKAAEIFNMLSTLIKETRVKNQLFNNYSESIV